MPTPGAKVFLVLEDNADDAFLVGRAFKSLDDCMCHVCRNILEAQSYLLGSGLYDERARYPLPHAVMSDLHLGPESGLDFFNWMQACKQFNGIHTILLTGSASPRDLGEVAKIRGLRVIEKPMDLAGLKKIVNTLCDSV